ncbi:cationic amino acid transporter 1-like protein [Tanacetum coccineum]
MRARSPERDDKKTNSDSISFGLVMGRDEAGVFCSQWRTARDFAGPAVLLSYLISGFAALLSVLCYTEFAVELPVAGGSFAYLRVELGDFVAYIAAGNILFEYVVAGASGLQKGMQPILHLFAPFGIRGVLKASSVLFFAYVGFDGVATLGEETKNPARDILIGLVGSMMTWL